ncbi:hypothetical protein MRB53_028652 [Persea americana]|uniref:Uncharacterized protein n=1 Tax=Persea americana TaxID=3435 RepID=A0ACC2KGB2_PERAE|nr:hypothetical protein MRB53_028652 [Persea americana]
MPRFGIFRYQHTDFGAKESADISPVLYLFQSRLAKLEAWKKLLGFLNDPYVVLKLGNQTAKTKVINSCLNPVWNEEFTFFVMEPPGVLNLEVFDKDRFKADDKMGRAHLNIQAIASAARMKRVLQVSAGETKLRKIVPSLDNCLLRDSFISCVNVLLLLSQLLQLRCRMNVGLRGDEQIQWLMKADKNSAARCNFVGRRARGMRWRTKINPYPGAASSLMIKISCILDSLIWNGSATSQLSEKCLETSQA